MLQSPVFLLLATGALLGLNFPLGKIAVAAAVPGIVWATLISASAAIFLGVVLASQRKPVRLDARHLRYFAVTAVISYALPNLLVLAAIPHLGSGLTAIFFTLSPILTVALSALAGLRRPQPLELAGIGVGLAGALLVVSGRGEIGRPAELVWLAAAALVPVLLACGNVYRTLDWPEDANLVWLAVGSNTVSALLLAAAALATTGPGAAASILAVPGAALAQGAAAAGMFFLYFRLQKVGGPVTLSQIGTAAAGVGVCIGAVLLGERYPAVVWAGVAVIAAGLMLTAIARRRA